MTTVPDTLFPVPAPSQRHLFELLLRFEGQWVSDSLLTWQIWRDAAEANALRMTRFWLRRRLAGTPWRLEHKDRYRLTRLVRVEPEA